MTDPVCDLVLLTWDHLEETQPCVESLVRHTDVPSRLLIVDNGSVSPAKEFVASVKPSGAIVEVRVLRNPSNEGYPRGMNRGLRESTAPYVCLLNNDLLVAPGWLSELIAVAASHPRIGIVNPSSETLGQHPGRGQTLDGYAAELQRLRGQWIEMGACVGFCMLIKREVTEQIGLLGEQFGMGYFEDTDYCLRARHAGYTCVRAKAAFVHHKENRSFKDTWRTQRDQDAQFDRSAQVFYATWGKPERRAYVVVADGTVGRLREDMLQQANRDGVVVMFAPRQLPSLTVPEHTNITYKPIAGRGFALRVLWTMVKKKKKFDRIIINHRGLGRVFRQLRWLHRACVDVQDPSPH